MRPISMVVQAFGSYGGRLEIDFSRLSRYGVFSITGPTGSGKTTIFDAMVYALYGDLPGSRIVPEVRSHFAEPATETRVELDFDVKGERWHIERTPSQERPKQRGEGTTPANAKVLLRKVDGASGGFTRQREVDSRIEELIGLNVMQFQQVVLLPQGEFEKLLKSDTTDRAQLLRRLFPVEIFDNFTDRLKLEADGRRDDYLESQRSGEQHLNTIRSCLESATTTLERIVPTGINLEIFEPVQFDGSHIDTSLAAIEVARVKFEAATTTARESFEKEQLAFTQLEGAAKRFDEYHLLKVEQEGFASDIERDAQLKKRLDLAQIVAPVADQIVKFPEFNSRAEECDRLVATQLLRVDSDWLGTLNETLNPEESELAALGARLNSHRHALTQAHESHKSLIATETDLKRLNTEVSKASSEIKELKKSRAQIDKELKKVRFDLKEFGAVTKKSEANEQELENLEEKIGNAEFAEELSLRIASANAKVKKMKLAVDRASKKLEDLRVKFECGLATTLAKTLVKGEPCPTCGSLDHPRPARSKNSSVSSEDIEIAVKKVKAAEKAYRDATRDLAKIEGEKKGASRSGNLESLRAKWEVAQNLREAIDKAIENAEDLSEREKSLVGDLEDNASQLSELEKIHARGASELDTILKRYRADVAIFEKTHGPLTEFKFDAKGFDAQVRRVADLANAVAERAGARRDLASVRSALEPVAKKLSIEDLARLQPFLISNDEQLNMTKTLEESTNRRRFVNETVARLENEGVPTSRPELDTAEEALTVARSRHSNLTGDLALVDDRLNTIRRARTALAHTANASEGLRQALEVAQTLYKIASGQTAASNDVRVSLSEWVLSDYLTTVLWHANARLDKMSSGRYLLQINSTGGDLRGRHGLDLEVFDATTGRCRSARSLSGGETFKAALALALGLADVVSAGKNKDLGALFIDEGFGTLDGESLESVIAILDSLQEMGNRMVAVISHVEELKSTIPQGIVVSHDERGSHCDLKYPDNSIA
jgi:DNA repair protein SbcC/Rad50